MTRFHGIKCLPALLLGLMHKLALPHPPPHLVAPFGGGNVSRRHASGSSWIDGGRLR